MDSKEFKECVMPYYRKMYFTAFRILADSSSASDAVQESFKKLFMRMEVLSSVDSVEAYCMGVVRNEALGILRSRKTVIADLPEESASTESDAFADKDELNYVLGLLDRLPPDQKTVILLSSVDGLDNDEIASRTGFSESNVRQLLSRGRKKLKELYRKL